MKLKIILSLFFVLILSSVLVYADNNSGNQCAKEGEYTSGAVSPEYYFGCCSGLQGLNTKPGMVGNGLLCYKPDKGVPACQFSGTRSEGWYYPGRQLLKYDSCGNSNPACLARDGACCKGETCTSGATTPCENQQKISCVCDTNCIPQCSCQDSNATSCSSQLCSDGSTAKCYQGSSGCTCETCPPIIIEPVCGNGLCESGEGLTCVVAEISCESGKECVAPKPHCNYSCAQDCKNIPGINTQLNEKFKLQVNQQAKINDFSNLKITFLDLITSKCEIGQTSSNDVKEKLAKQIKEETTDSDSNSRDNARRQYTPKPVSILKCPASGPMAQLEVEMPKINSKKILTLKLNEAKSIIVRDNTKPYPSLLVSFLNYDYASRTGEFVVDTTNEQTPSCRQNCECDSDGNVIECYSLPFCDENQILCPDGICRQICSNSSTDNCNYGCLYNSKCFTIGTRAPGLFCSIDGTMNSQLVGEEKCENNFECKSNVCIDSQCVSSGLIQKFFSWFKNLFGSDKPKPADEKDCNTDEDCECGVHIKTGECFYGNKEFVDTNVSRLCPDFCSGISGTLEIRCINNKCKQI